MDSTFNINVIPQEIAHYFEHKDINFEVSKFEEYMLEDIYQYDEQATIKLNRNVTEEFLEEIRLYQKQKRNIRYTLKGETRDGKSLIGLKLGDIIITPANIDFNSNVEKIVCGNQIEYRQKLKDAKFGDFYLVDENFFNQSGLGSNIEASQLKDYNAIIAKKNINVIYINPEKFLNVGATLGISTYGRDSKNWLSRALVYKFKDNFPYLIGYIVIDVGDLFRKHGCYIYKFTGGCTNTEKVKFKDIPKEVIKHSKCIPKKYAKNKLDNKGEVCPFYNVCTHGLCKYEHKKDTWIDAEMTGTLDERTKERFELSLKIILELYSAYNEDNNMIRLNARNNKDLKNRVRLIMPKYTNTKMGIGEYDELLEIIKTNCALDMLVETLRVLENDDLKKQYFDLECSHIIKELYLANEVTKKKK